MITLIKIRCKYFSNHHCAVFWSYFFIPAISLISLPLLLIYNSNYKDQFYEKNKIEGIAFNITKELFSQNLAFNNYNFSLVSNDEKDKEIMQDLVKSEIEWPNKDSNINKENNIIKINNDYDNEYKIELCQSRDFSIFYSRISYNSDLFRPPKDIISRRRYFFEEFDKFIEILPYYATF